MSTNEYKFVKRAYRELMAAEDLTFFQVKVEQTDLFIGIGGFSQNESETRLCKLEKLKKCVTDKIVECRHEIERYIKKRPEFLTSLEPIQEKMPCTIIIQQMLQATQIAEVGPMASVAGTIAQEVGLLLSVYCQEVIVENGGDIWLFGSKKRVVDVFAGDSLLNGKIKLCIYPNNESIGLCTSSGTIGHSLSFGKTDAVTVKAKSAILADAVATSLGNKISKKEDMDKALNWACSLPGVKGVLVIIENCIGLQGDMELKG